MAIPTVYRWDHKNSPKITNNQDWTQIKNWFQKIFVDGYLADDDVTLIPGLGWDFTFDDGLYHIILTMDSGADPQIVNRSVLTFKYKDVINNGYFGGHGNFYENDQGGLIISRFGYDNESTNVSYGMPLVMGINNKGTDRICPYVVIGNNRGVYFLGGYNNAVTSPTIPPFSSSNGYASWAYYGDFINDGPDYGKNNQCSTYCYYNSQSNTTYYQHNDCSTLADWLVTVRYNRVYSQNNLAPYYNGIHIARDHVGGNRGLNFTATPFMMGTINGYLGASNKFNLKYPYIDGGLKIVPHELWTRNPIDPVEAGNRQQVYVGKMPGLYYPLHVKPLSYTGNTKNIVEFEGTGVYENQYFIGLARSTADEFYINTSEDWGI